MLYEVITIDIYDNEIFFLTNKFLSPVAGTAPVFYKFFIIDTSVITSYSIHYTKLYEKASVIDGESGVCLASAFSPETEMKMMALNPGWAEQDPEIWWEHLATAVRKCLSATGKRKNDISAIGISYQMHGLVLVDNERRVIRPSIIWCDSRAVDYGKRAMDSLVV